jgi:hypothetical protein
VLETPTGPLISPAGTRHANVHFYSCGLVVASALRIPFAAAYRLGKSANLATSCMG